VAPSSRAPRPPTRLVRLAVEFPLSAGPREEALGLLHIRGEWFVSCVVAVTLPAVIAGER
jgi:hypothetical protein